MRKLKKNWCSILITTVIWLITNISPIHKIFLDDTMGINVILSMILQYAVLFSIVRQIVILWLERKEEVVKQEIVIACAFATIYFTALVLVWPGMWSWDDVSILNNAQHYNLTAWQHFLSGLWHTVCLRTFPFSSGVLIMQVTVASLITGYCISHIADVFFGQNKRFRILSEIVLFLPTIAGPVMMYLFTGYRMGIYSFLELLLVTIMLLHVKTEGKLEKLDFICIIGLTVIVASWRSEAIYYPILMVLIFVAMGKEKVKRYQAIVCMMIALFATVLIGKYNDKLIGTNNYSVSATVLPVGELIKTCDWKADVEEIQAIHNVLNVDVIYLNGSWSGEAYLWNAIQPGYTKEDLEGYYRAYLKLALKYPETVIRETGQMFLNTAGILLDENGCPIVRTTCTGTNVSTMGLTGFDTWTSNGSLFADAINTNVRENAIRWIACIDSNGKATWAFRIVWNLLIPLSLSCICMVYLLIKKRCGLCAIFLCVCARVPLITLTACAPYFMYYLSVYLVGYVLSLTVLMEIVQKKL